MTMILTCLTKDYIVQASDRRLSYTDGKKNDHSNKALIYDRYFMFAYTGLASLSLKNAIDWAAERLSEKENLNVAVNHLRDRASDLMNNYYKSLPTSIKRLAFIGAGFVNVGGPEQKRLRPIRLVVSNFRGENNTWLGQAYKSFRVDEDHLPENQTFRLLVAGQLLKPERNKRLNELLKWCIRHEEKPEIIGRFLAREIQLTAKDNEFVGENIMCTFVPRIINFDNKVLHFGPLLLENPVFSTEPQVLQPRQTISIHERFTLPPPFDGVRFVYIRGDNAALPYPSPVYVGPGKITSGEIYDMSVTVPPFLPIRPTEADPRA